MQSKQSESPARAGLLSVTYCFHFTVNVTDELKLPLLSQPFTVTLCEPTVIAIDWFTVVVPAGP